MRRRRWHEKKYQEKGVVAWVQEEGMGRRYNSIHPPFK
jgi:hypothetical protein